MRMDHHATLRLPPTSASRTQHQCSGLHQRDLTRSITMDSEDSTHLRLSSLESRLNQDACRTPSCDEGQEGYTQGSVASGSLAASPCQMCRPDPSQVRANTRPAAVPYVPATTGTESPVTCTSRLGRCPKLKEAHRCPAVDTAPWTDRLYQHWLRWLALSNTSLFTFMDYVKLRGGTMDTSTSRPVRGCTRSQKRIRDPDCSRSRRPGALSLPCRPNLLSLVLTLFSVIAITPCNSTDPEWIQWPQDTSVALFEQATFYCEISGGADDVGIMWKQIQEDNTAVTLFINEQRWNAPGHYSVTYNENEFSSHLHINGALTDDDNIYECEINYNTNIDKRNGQLTVEVAPGEPSISTNHTGQKEEGYWVEFHCQSDGGNPQPTIRWLRDGSVLIGHTTHQDGKFNTTHSYLVRVMEPADDGAVYQCRVDNNVGSEQSAQTQQLDVHYNPRVDVGQYNPLIVEEQDNVTLVCLVNANPAATVRWEKIRARTETSAHLNLGIVTAEHTGSYTCTASNTLNTVSQQLELNVQYGPRVHVVSGDGQWSGTILSVEESTSVTLTCQVQANPGTTADPGWYTADDVHIKDGGTLTFISVHRGNTGGYYCQASNQLTPSGGSTVTRTNRGYMTLVVQYGPGQAEMTAPGGVVIGDTTALHCDVDDPGEPEAYFIWEKAGGATLMETTETLTLTNVQLSDSGDYTCTPKNTIGEGGSDTQTFEVYEVPLLLSLAYQELQYEISEVDVAITCQVRAKPDPVISWQKDGQSVTAGAYYDVTDVTEDIRDGYGSVIVTSTLSFTGTERDGGNHLRVEDTGQYICTAVNIVSTTDITAIYDVEVHYAPVMYSPEPTVAIDTNTSAELICQAHALPEPSFRWFNGSAEMLTGGRIQIVTSQVEGEYPYQSVLTITDVQYSDLGYYTCQGHNDKYTSDLVIQLTVKTVPEPPTNLHAIDKTWESVLLTWEAGFDGGYTQEFIITYTSPGSPTVRVNVGSVTEYNVSNLFPETIYNFKVFSENKLGGGEYSNNISVKTDEYIIPPPKDVFYYHKTRTLEFTTLDTGPEQYCARVDVHDGLDWDLYEPCAPTEGGSIRIADEWLVDMIQMAHCLDRRPKICSDNVTAIIVDEQDDTPVSVIIAVGCVCGTIILVLLIILIVLCYRRYQSQRKNSGTASPSNQPVVPQSDDKPDGSVQPAVNGRGVENRALDSIDLDDPGNSQVFSTDTSKVGPYGDIYAQPSIKKKQNGIANGHAGNGHTGNGHPPQWNNPSNTTSSHCLPAGPPPRYDNVLPPPRSTSPENPYVSAHRARRKNPDNHFIQLENPYAHHTPHETSKEGSSDSGVSTPDPQKPKKVIYEVVV